LRKVEGLEDWEARYEVEKHFRNYKKRRKRYNVRGMEVV